MISHIFKLAFLTSCTFFVKVAATTCRENCGRTYSNKINIHLIPHTHDDVGWLKTVDQYYYGSNKGHAPPGVQYILDSVVSELLKNPARRFVYVESAYFWRWWEEQDKAGQDTVRQLIEEGRLEFLHGGWCMSDEATPHYSAMIDQMTLGLKFLNDTFGECARPSVSWQIDPFGHSSEVAIEFAEMGFDGLFVGRIDYEDQAARKKAQHLEMIWRPDPALGEEGELFTSVLYDLYTAPSGFCFDAYCSDEPIMDNKKLHGYNVVDRIQKFLAEMDKYKSVYKTNNIIVTMGSDFTYTVASSWFKNMDKLIKYANNMSETYNLLYSTPSCYLKTINALNTTWPIKESDDFFPYGSDEHSYWTGYFTSRPSFKYWVYKANNILQATKQVATILGNELEEQEFSFKRSLAISQHHDAVSGTEKQHVTDDYATYLHEGVQYGKAIFQRFYKKIYGDEYPNDQDFCNLRNISECSISEEKQNFIITLYNPLTRSISVSVRFPITDDAQYQVHRQTGSPIDQDLVPISENVQKVPGRRSKATQDLTFITEDLPPMGITNYYVQVSPLIEKKGNGNGRKIPEGDTLVLDNGIIKLTFNKTDGLLQSVTKKGNTWPFHQNFYYYDAMKGYNYDAKSRASGAYIFRPVQNDQPKKVSTNVSLSAFYGKNVFEVHQQFSPWLSQIVRLYKGTDDVEFEWLVTIPINDWTGMEVVTKYITDVASNDVFYTDSNGRRWEKRIRNQRKYWNLTSTNEPIACNYYPITTAMRIRDNFKQVTVITDRPEGGTSMKSGELEIMLHRRLLYDDNKGVVEPLDETAFGQGLFVRGKHTIQINDLTVADLAHRLKVTETTYAPVPMFAKTSFTLSEWTSNFNRIYKFLQKELPPSIHILTLERWRPSQLLLRLEHLFQADENSTYARPVTVNIKNLFIPFNVTEFQELTLAANREKLKLKRLKWHYEDQSKKTEPKSTSTIMLQPMQIRTFLLFFEKDLTFKQF